MSSVEAIRRLLAIAVVDALGLENSIARSRALAYLSQLSLKTLEAGELEEKVSELEGILRVREPKARSRR